MNTRIKTLIIAAIILSSCAESPTSDDFTGDTRTPSESDMVAALQAQLPEVSNADDLFRAAAAIEPWFGGFYISEGVLQVVSTEPGVHPDRANALTRAALMSAGHRGAESLARGAAIVSGRYSFGTLASYFDQILPYLHRFAVIETDLDERANRIRLSTETQSGAERLSEWIRQAALPVDAFHISVTSPPLDHYKWGGHETYIYWNISKTVACTLTQVVTRMISAGVVSDTLYGITASHCTGQLGSGTSTRFATEPGGSWLADEVWDHPLITNSTCEGLTGGSTPACRYSDAALFRYRPAYWGQLEPHMIQVDASPLVKDSLEGEARLVFVGESIRMFGKDSHLQTGEVKQTCVNLMKTSSGPGMLCQVKADYEAQGGDSGGPVWVYRDFKPLFAGIHWGVDNPVYGDYAIFSRVHYLAQEIVPDTPGWGELCLSFDSFYCMY